MEQAAVMCFDFLFCWLICSACCGEEEKPISSEPPRATVNPVVIPTHK